MAKKIKDFLLSDIFASAGFGANEIEFINAASDLSEVEISDELVKKFHDNMLSKDAALNSPELEKQIRPKLWAEFATILDKRLATDAFPHLDEIQKTTVNEIKNTPDKVGKALEFLTAKKPKQDDSEVQKKYDELILKHGSQQTSYESQISTIKETHTSELEEKDNRFTDYRIDNLIKEKINDEVLIDNIPGGKNYLADSIASTIRKDPNFILGLDSSGSGLVFKDRKDPTLKFIQNNKEVVLKQVLDPLIKDWKKNSPGSGPKKPKTDPDPLPDGRPLTFQQMNAEKARLNLEEAVANQG